MRSKNNRCRSNIYLLRQINYQDGVAFGEAGDGEGEDEDEADAAVALGGAITVELFISVEDTVVGFGVGVGTDAGLENEETNSRSDKPLTAYTTPNDINNATSNASAPPLVADFPSLTSFQPVTIGLTKLFFLISK